MPFAIPLDGQRGHRGPFESDETSRSVSPTLSNGSSAHTEDTAATDDVVPSPVHDEEPYDLVCVGFGPASLAIAVALHDRKVPIRALFLERQSEFSWHSGMILPGTHMQISFIKDLATLRDPRSHFTFLNYLHEKGRLVAFTNLSTFLPLREEYNDYLSWCASHFSDKVRYSETVVSVTPVRSESGKTTSWGVVSQSAKHGGLSTFSAERVVIAVGGKPNIPQNIPQNPLNSRILHSSWYSSAVPQLLADKDASYRVAVVGAGQSSAEIFNDLHGRFPNSKTALFIRQHALRPSDDSPFVNEIFDPDRVDQIYTLPPDIRSEVIRSDKATNYSVVRLELLESLYGKMYQQRLRNPDETQWPHRIFPLREVAGTEEQADGRLKLKLRHTRTGEEELTETAFDAVIFGTGYIRDVHHTLLQPAANMLEGGNCSVDREYRVQFREGEIAEDSGIWLQGCCESTHGLSDTLLSILSVRASELVDSVFKDKTKASASVREGLA